MWFPVWACGHVDCKGQVTASPNMPPPHTTASGKLLFLLTLPCARVIRLQIHRWMCVYVLHSTDFGPSLHFLKLPCTRLRFQGCALCVRGRILKRWINFMQYLLKTKDNGNSSNFLDYHAPADYVYRRCCACVCLEVFDKCLLPLSFMRSENTHQDSSTMDRSRNRESQVLVTSGSPIG